MITDSAFVKDGKFTIVGTAPEGTAILLDGIQKSRFKNSYNRIRLLIDNNEKITIKCKEDVKNIPCRGV